MGNLNDKTSGSGDAVSQKSDNNVLSGSIIPGSSEGSCCPKLTLKQRLFGWLFFSIIGWILSLFSTVSLIVSDMAQFAVLYSIGQILNLAASTFLSSPQTQWKDMTSKQRRITSAVYLISIILTLVIALATPVPGLSFLFLVIQVCAYYWYTLSFVPCGQKILKKLCLSCCTQ